MPPSAGGAGEGAEDCGAGVGSGQTLRRRRLRRRVQAQDGREPQSCQGFPNRSL